MVPLMKNVVSKVIYITLISLFSPHCVSSLIANIMYFWTTSNHTWTLVFIRAPNK